ILKNGKTNGFLFEIEFLLMVRSMDFNVQEVLVQPREGLVFSNVDLLVLFKNFLQYIKLFFARN
ncbi:MAG TPA: hypothetical protein PKD85_14600, partial [Saprospiraceae bacterium]|nr:hypothetical protein [Saprospiraceae bacterium]